MRVTFSLLISTLVCSSLDLNYSVKLDYSHKLLNNTEAKMLFSAKPKSRLNQPENPIPNRGSGRRDLIESVKNILPVA